MDADTDTAPPTATLTVIVDPSGTVTDGFGVLDCRAGPTGTCTADVALGATAQLTATADLDYAFVDWGGDCSGTQLATDVLVDGPTAVRLHVPAEWGADSRAHGQVPVGTEVDVYFVHFDPVGVGTRTFLAELALPGDIIGIVAGSSLLDLTDLDVGLPSVQYSDAGTHSNRGLELASTDTLALTADRRGVVLDFTTFTSSDQLRIITLASGAMVPAALAAGNRPLPRVAGALALPPQHSGGLAARSPSPTESRTPLAAWRETETVSIMGESYSIPFEHRQVCCVMHTVLRRRRFAGSWPTVASWQAG